MAPSMTKSSLLNLINKKETSNGRNPVIDRRKSITGTAGVMNSKTWQVVAPPWTVHEVSCSEKAGYLDRKWALQGDESAGWLVLDFEVKNEGTPLALCEVCVSLLHLFK
jgi:hypothetical protein